MERASPIAGRYEVVREIGRGGMATVFLARQLELERLVALKGLIGLRVDEPGWAERFLREARLAGSLNHDRIVTVHDFFKADGTPFIAMEYLPRGSLRPLIGQLSREQVVGVLEDMLDALQYAERRGIVHRDIKPENLLVTDDGRVKIADFGIAKAVDAATGVDVLTAAGAALGTPAYMAPEQAMGGDVTPAADRYAVGVTAYELLAGAPPFAADTPMALMLRHLQEPVPPLRDRSATVPPPLAAWVEQLLAKQPDERFASAAEAQAELANRLHDVLGADPRRRRPTAPLPTVPPGEKDGASGTPPVTPPDTGAVYETYDEPPPRAATTRAPAAAEPPETPSPRSTGARRRRAAIAATVVAVAVAVGVALLLDGDSPEERASESGATPTATASEPAFVDAGTVTIDGDPLRVEIETPGTGARARFDGREGQRVALFAPKVSFGSGGAVIDVYDPGDDSLTPSIDTFDANQRELKYSLTLPATGSYTITVLGDDGAGSLELRLVSDAEADVRVDGPPVKLRFDTAGQNAIARFRGREGQRVALYAPDVNLGSGGAVIDVYDPGDDSLTPSIDTFDANQRELKYSLTLPTTGTYAIVVLPDAGETGSIDLQLSTDTEAQLRVDGPPIKLRFDTAGQNAIARFRGREGQRVAVFASNFAVGRNAGGSVVFDVYDPGGDSLTPSIDSFDAGNGELGYSLTLPTTGTYAIVLLPQGGQTGSFDLRLPSDVRERARIDGRAVTVRFDTPGQNATVAFEGSGSQRVDVLASDFTLGANAGGSAAVEVYDPGDDEITPGSDTLSAGKRTLDNTLELPTSGTYWVVIRPERGQIGSLRLRLRSR